MHRPRHCMIVNNTYPDVRVEREARALVDHGYAVDVMCMQGGNRPIREMTGDIRVFRLPVWRRRGQGIRVQLTEYVSFLAWAAAMTALQHRRHHYTSVQVHNVPDFLVFAAAFPKLAGIPLILDLHDLMPEFFASRFGREMDAPAVRAVLWEERVSTAFADKVLTVTDLWRERLVARGLSPDKVEVVMNLPDPALFPVQQPSVKPVGVPLTFLYHGSFTYRYGIDVLLRAFAIASKDHHIRMIVHGRGEYQEDIRCLVSELDLGDRVELSTKWIPSDLLPDLIRSADVGVVPYRRDLFTDGILPTKLMEYAALGVPAIASRTSAVGAYFTDEMVRYVEPEDVSGLARAIAALAADPNERLAIATNAQRFTREHQWHDEALKYV
ncbi:MAG TPA: glycosyltransferase family 4 protein, partial [Thermomicrobiales bacterium]|nr:glycosyltransferase family 4 protein [Thermomicrobiales bacterium]